VEKSDVGVPQGTLSGPIFWLIFADDLQPPIPTVKYADNTTSYDVVTSGNITTMNHTSATAIDVSLGEDRIQSALTYSHQWLTNNGMSSNVMKTATLHVSVRKSIEIRNRVSIGDEPRQTTRTAKFLGLTIESHLTFKDHVEERVQKRRQAAYTLIKLKRAGVPPTALVQVYCTRIRTIVPYTTPAWFTMISNTSLNKLEGLQRLCLRVTYPELRSYSERLTIAGITTLADHLASSCKKYIQKAALPTHRLSGRVPMKRECHRVTRQKHYITYKTALRKRSFFVSMFL